MSNTLNFSSQFYKDRALHTRRAKYQNERTAKDAFMLIIKELPYEDLNNLGILIQTYYKNSSANISLTENECYELMQGNNTEKLACDDNFKRVLLELAYDCVDKNQTLGTKTTEDGKYICSAWINHALLHAEVSATLAKEAGLDPDTARKLGLLHDIGRKYTHTCLHTIAGYEYLVDEKWYKEAPCCLTHSFLGRIDQKDRIRGSRCACCDKVVKGFYIDENGEPQWAKEAPKDDITLFLKDYTYSPYDVIINIADLMATDNKITSPYQRVTDIATRKPLDPTTKNFFKATFCNIMIYFLEAVREIEFDSEKELKATNTISDESMDIIFSDVSNLFTTFYNRVANTKIVTKEQNPTMIKKPE